MQNRSMMIPGILSALMSGGGLGGGVDILAPLPKPSIPASRIDFRRAVTRHPKSYPVHMKPWGVRTKGYNEIHGNGARIKQTEK